MVLERIVKANIEELEARRLRTPLAELKRMALAQPPPLDLAPALRGDGIRLIAEVKRASPSRGVIRQDFQPLEIARTYAAGGASAISVLTEPRFFQGSLDHLREIRDGLGDRRVPLLRKDFIFDRYQLYESRACGADAVLLIVAILTPEKLVELMGLARELGMSCLVEVHDKAETETAVASGATIIGINNRDLKTFTVDINTTKRLRPLVPPDRIVVSESGIKGRSDIAKLRQWGADAVLIGEALMSAPDIGARMRELM